MKGTLVLSSISLSDYHDSLRIQPTDPEKLSDRLKQLIKPEDWSNFESWPELDGPVERRAPRRAQLLLAQLPPTIGGNQLRRIFSRHGPILSIAILQGRSVNYGLIRFGSAGPAIRLGNRSIKLNGGVVSLLVYSPDLLTKYHGTAELLVGQVPAALGYEMTREFFYGFEGVVEVALHQLTEKEKLIQVIFSDVRSVKAAMLKLGKCPRINGHHVSVRPTKTFYQRLRASCRSTCYRMIPDDLDLSSYVKDPETASAVKEFDKELDQLMAICMSPSLADLLNNHCNSPEQNRQADVSTRPVDPYLKSHVKPLADSYPSPAESYTKCRPPRVNVNMRSTKPDCSEIQQSASPIVYSSRPICQSDLTGVSNHIEMSRMPLLRSNSIDRLSDGSASLDTRRFMDSDESYLMDSSERDLGPTTMGAVFAQEQIRYRPERPTVGYCPPQPSRLIRTVSSPQTQPYSYPLCLTPQTPSLYVSERRQTTTSSNSIMVTPSELQAVESLLGHMRGTLAGHQTSTMPAPNRPANTMFLPVSGESEVDLMPMDARPLSRVTSRGFFNKQFV